MMIDEMLSQQGQETCMTESVPPETLTFTDTEIAQLGRTADALSAWLGKPVLGEVVNASETGYEWVLFAIPLLPGQDTDSLVVVQVGGKNARLLGNHGGLKIQPNTTYSCQFLWAIQLSDIKGIRYIKIDQAGDEIAWTNQLEEILPFDLDKPPLPDD